MAGENFQIPLPLVQYEFEAEIIHQRVRDGYVNATAMCKASGKAWADYNRLTTTNAYLAALSADMGIPITALVQSIRGGTPELQGTWVHPQVAIALAQWLSPEFAVKVTKWVFDWMSGKVPGGNLPYHLRRYMANMTKVPAGYWSMLNEMTISLMQIIIHRFGKHFGKNHDLYVFPDKAKELKGLNEMKSNLNNNLSSFHGLDDQPIKAVEFRDSASTLFLQFNDMILGGLCYQRNNRNEQEEAGRYKSNLAGYIHGRTGIVDLSKNTPRSKMNISVWNFKSDKLKGGH